MQGTVAEFDEPKGYGTVRSDDGQSFFFHCTQIADGTRTIPDGAEVMFEVVPGRNGRWEATDITRR
ncbi:MAG: cold shock domain-containing protein [Acidimicrobiia bacterium]|nr:cold shock domain-containing protein [Acidimicrobiia bacterium]